jgi:peptidoglycan/LPS O-acetylase OafA/YrhL
MRGVAALLVLAGHALYFSHPNGGQIAEIGKWTGPCGVVVFFLISGFLLYRPFVAARGGDGLRVGAIAPSFFGRRAVRILPAYWVAITLLAIWPGLIGAFSARWWVDSGLSQNSRESRGGTGLGTAWSLCVEVSFYLALPFVALFLQDRGVGVGRDHRRELRWELGVLGGIALLSLGWRAWAGSDPATIYLVPNLFGTFSWFCLGMLIAAIQVSPFSILPKLRRVLASPAICWSATLLAFAFLASEVDRGGAVPGAFVVILETTAAGVFALGLVGPAVLDERDSLVHRLFANPAIVFLGTVSYGVYLYHLPIVNWLTTAHFVMVSPQPAMVLCVVAFLGSVALGTASWYLVERPLMRRVRSVKAYADVKEADVEIPPQVEPVREGAGRLATATER